MSSEHAAELVASARRDGALAKRLRRALMLPGGIKKFLGDALAEQVAYNRHWHVRVHDAELQGHLDALSDRAWARLRKTLLPHLVPTVESTESILARRPFQRGGFRKPFRCPNSAVELRHIRGRWLADVAVLLGDFDQDIHWIAKVAAHLPGSATNLGWLLAGAIDSGDDEVFQILRASAMGEHDVGEMGGHVIHAFLACARPEAWEFVEKLLLAAQRQEGLRQSILEAIDESHPEAFRRMLRVILEHDLARFSSVVRAVDTWFGFAWDGASGMKVKEILETVLRFLEHPEQRALALASDDTTAEAVYLALWTIAFDDVDAVIEPATRLRSHIDPEKRFVATHLLVQTNWTVGYPALRDALGDEDLRVASRALSCFANDLTKWMPSSESFPALEALMQRVEKRKQALEPIVWPWWSQSIERTTIAAAMSANLQDLEVERLLPYVKDLETWPREQVLRAVTGLGSRWQQDDSTLRPLTGSARDLALRLISDTSPDVRSAAFESLKKSPVEQDEVERLLSMLHRKAGDLRNRCLARLALLDDDGMFATARTLLDDKNTLKRQAGLELLRDAIEKRTDSVAAEARALATEFRASDLELADEEVAHLEAILGDDETVATREDCLGLIDPDRLPEFPRPQSRTPALESTATTRCVDELAKLVLEHAEDEFEDRIGERHLLINAGWRFQAPDSPDHATEREPHLPLGNLWREWFQNRGPHLRDDDGLELVRGLLTPTDSRNWSGKSTQELLGRGHNSDTILQHAIEWGVFWEPARGSLDLVLDALEQSMYGIRADELEQLATDGDRYFYGADAEATHRVKGRATENWIGLARSVARLQPNLVSDAEAVRLYRLLRWYQIARRGGRGWVPMLEEFLAAYRAGGFGDHGCEEFVDLAIGRGFHPSDGRLVREITGVKPPPSLDELPELQREIERIRRRVVEVETQRGDRSTAASAPTLDLRITGGLEAMAQAIQSLGSTKFARNFSWSNGECSRKDTLSHIVVRSQPGEGDTPEAFAAWAKSAKIKPNRLVELAAFAPQWVDYVDHVLAWPGFVSAVWWIHAHTKDDRWQFRDLREIWTAQVSERTPLSADDLTEGAVDVAWFRDAFEQLGAERWEQLHKAAKYASNSGGHKRAQLFAEAMTGAVTRQQLIERIDDKRHQDSVRALGLVPLDESNPAKDLLVRYERLQDFRRESRKFGSQRQQSESRAMTIGMENLARTAGYQDPLRLQWAMEMEAIQDLIEGPVTVARDDVTVTLAIDAEGQPELTVVRETKKGSKTLKSVPAKLKKDEAIAELKARAKELRKQASRVKGALEEAMCRGDTFTGNELQRILRHPVLAPGLSRLVFLGEPEIAGYPISGGNALEDHHGNVEPLRGEERVRVAHPIDLLARGDWHEWQKDCFARERVQPFKQVFREVYPLTDAERADKLQSRRYAGHQVGPKQALSLLGSRGWVAQPEEGVSRTFHDEGLTARLGFEEAFYSPADIEGLTVECVVFTKKGDWKALELADVPPRVFTETMRDLDLVVSVAHQGGVDPEATASTVEMRAALLRESCALLRLDNVEIRESNAIIRGELAEYSVHFGSAQAQLLGGRALYIVAVHSQHRGRLFLPFADDDPRTAEVLSKVLLLARDKRIQDPSILDQIRG